MARTTTTTIAAITKPGLNSVCCRKSPTAGTIVLISFSVPFATTSQASVAIRISAPTASASTITGVAGAAFSHVMRNPQSVAGFLA